MRANTAVLASFYATCTSTAAYSTAAAALVASSPPSPGAGRAQKEGNPTPFQNYELADGEELKARQGARDAGSVLVRNISSASTGSGGSQPWSPAFAAAEFCFTSSSRWLHAQPSTILRTAAQRLIIESAQLPAATEALLATDPCLNSSIKNIIDGIELREQQQRYNEDSTFDTPPSTINLRPAARRLLFESAQLPAATEAPPAADPCLDSSIKNMIGGMVERVHQLRCKASTLDTSPSAVSLLPAARRLIFESVQLPAAAEAVLQMATVHEPQPLCLCRDWSLAPVATSAVVKGSAWQPATRVEGFSIGAGDAQLQHIPASVAAVTAQQQPVKVFDMWSAPWLGGSISSRAICGGDAQRQPSTGPTSWSAVTAQQQPVKVFDMWSAPWLGSNISSRAICGGDAQRQPSTGPTSWSAVTAQQQPVKVFDMWSAPWLGGSISSRAICGGDAQWQLSTALTSSAAVAAQQQPVKAFNMWSGPSFAISNAERQPIPAAICSGYGTAQQQPLGAFDMWSSVWIGSSIVQVCA